MDAGRPPGAACAVIFVADIIVLNVVGDVSGWCFLAVPIGLLLVPLLGVFALLYALMDRRRA